MNPFLKPVPLVIFILLIHLKSFSQDKLSFGVRQSISLGTGVISGTSTTHNTLNIGYSTGVLAEWEIQKHIALRVETAFSKKGYSDRMIFTDAMGNAIADDVMKTNFYYLDVPVMGKFSVGKNVKPYLLLGGWSGIFLWGKIKYPDVTIPGSSSNMTNSQRFSAHTINYGIIVGPGLDIKIGSSILFIETRYCHAQRASVWTDKLVNLELGSGLRF